MQYWESILLMATGIGLLFWAMHHFGLMVVKSGAFLLGGAMGTRVRFWGEYQRMCGSVSKNFRVSPKHTTLTLRLEAVSGSARVEVSGPNKAVWYSWNFCCSLSEQIDCRGIRNCTVRISAEDFCGKFDILLQ